MTGGRRLRLSSTVGHYAPWLLVAMVGGLIALTLAPAVAALVGSPVYLAMIGATLFLGVAAIVHNRRLCERCVAALPLDAAAVASRYTRRFRVAHLFERRRFAIGYLAVVTASSLLYDHPVGRYGWAAVQGTLIYLLLAYVSHQRLQPWCPRCRNGGEEQAAPTAPMPLVTQR